jgi:hypothetical protein
MQPGDKVRFKTAAELVDTDGWVFDPFMHWWAHGDGSFFTREDEGASYTVKVSYGEWIKLDGWGRSINASALVLEEPAQQHSKCTCGAVIAGALGHYQWCDIGRDYGNVQRDL